MYRIECTHIYIYTRIYCIYKVNILLLHDFLYSIFVKLYSTIFIWKITIMMSLIDEFILSHYSNSCKLHSVWNVVFQMFLHENLRKMTAIIFHDKSKLQYFLDILLLLNLL